MEELNKEELNKLRQFFKQRNQQNEAKNKQVIDVVGPLLATIEASKLGEKDKLHYNEMVNALGNFILLTQQKWEVISELHPDFSVSLTHPKGKVKIISVQDESDAQQFKAALKEEYTHIILLSELNKRKEIELKLEKESPIKVWFFDTEKETTLALKPTHE